MKRWMTRYVPVVAALIIGAGSIGSGTALAAGKLVVARSSATGFVFDPLDIGIQQKFFEKNGLDVQEVSLDGSAKLHQAMIAGSLDIGLGAGTDISFLVKGSPEISVGAIALGPDLFGVVLGPDSTIKSLADLKGKRIGISTVGSLTQWLALQIVKKEGWTRNDITMVTVGSDSAAQAAALRTHQIDAMIGVASMGLQLAAQHQGSLLTPTSTVVNHFLANAVFASNKMIADRPDDVRAFLKGWYQTINWMFQHKAESVKAAQAIDGFNEDIESQQFDIVMTSMSRDGKFPADTLASVQQSFVDLGILPTAPDMTKYITEKYLSATP